MSLLLNTCEGMTNRVLVDDGARWIQHGEEQESENRTAGVKAPCSMLASTTSGRAKELGKQGLSDRNGMIAFGRIRQRFGNRWCGEALRRVSVPVDMTSLGDDARRTFTIAGLERAKERSLEQHLRLRAPQTWTVLCASVDQWWTQAVSPSHWKLVP